MNRLISSVKMSKRRSSARQLSSAVRLKKSHGGCDLQEKENARKQEEYLEQVYQQRLSHESDAESWDPIEDVMENERDTYIAFITHFLWLKKEKWHCGHLGIRDASDRPPAKASKEGIVQIDLVQNGEAIPQPTENGTARPYKSKKKKHAKGKKQTESQTDDPIFDTDNPAKKSAEPPSRFEPVLVRSADTKSPT